MTTPQDFFAYFEFDQHCQLDLEALDTAYLSLQAQVHPDRFAHGTPSERASSLQQATLLNQAYQTLRDPLATRIASFGTPQHAD